MQRRVGASAMMRTSSNTAHRPRVFLSIAVVLFVSSVKIEAAPLPASPSADRLQTLIHETVAQFQIAYRMHPEAAGLRQQQLNAVVSAWRAAPRNDVNNER